MMYSRPLGSDTELVEIIEFHAPTHDAQWMLPEATPQTLKANISQLENRFPDQPPGLHLSALASEDARRYRADRYRLRQPQAPGIALSEQNQYAGHRLARSRRRTGREGNARPAHPSPFRSRCPPSLRRTFGGPCPRRSGLRTDRSPVSACSRWRSGTSVPTGPLNRVVHIWSPQGHGGPAPLPRKMVQDVDWTEGYLPLALPLVVSQENTILTAAIFSPLR
jgi:hypothetical protein